MLGVSEEAFSARNLPPVVVPAPHLFCPASREMTPVVLPSLLLHS
jgi:hypothetical protein